jgi:hypothetical protein
MPVALSTMMVWLVEQALAVARHLASSAPALLVLRLVQVAQAGLQLVLATQDLHHRTAPLTMLQPLHKVVLVVVSVHLQLLVELQVLLPLLQSCKSGTQMEQSGPVALLTQLHGTVAVAVVVVLLN